MLDKLGLFAKKYLFASILIIVGVVLVIMSLKPVPVIERTQSSWFLIGGLSILISGVVTLLYVLEIISRMIHLLVMGVLFVTCAVLTVLSIKSLEETIEKRNLYETYQNNGKQALDDIRTIQMAYKKTYGKFAPDFKELKRFLMNDKTYRTIPKVLHPSGKIPDRRPNDEEIAILGYDPFEDEALITDGIDEAEAIILGYYKVDTVWVPVLESLFFNNETNASEIVRRYEFEPEKVDVVRMPFDTTVNYMMLIAELDSASNAFMVYDPYAYNPFRENHQKRDTLKMGNLNDGSLIGSWEQ